MTFSKKLAQGALVSLLGLIFLFELFLRLSVPSGFWYRQFNLTSDFTSLAEIRDRLRYMAPGEGPRVLALGDSILGATALMEHRLPKARQKTLGIYLNQELSGRGSHLIPLGADGALLPDLAALAGEIQRGNIPPNQLPPEKILLILNFRMFAQDFASGPKALSREFLKEDLPSSILQAIGTDPKRTEENALSDQLYGFLSRHCFLFRESQMAKNLWYYPSQKDFFQRQLEHVMGPPKEDSDFVEAGLKLKIATYYQAYHWPADALPFQSLDLLLGRLKECGVPVEVILSPQNPGFMGDYLDRPSYEFNRKNLANVHEVTPIISKAWISGIGPTVMNRLYSSIIAI